MAMSISKLRGVSYEQQLKLNDQGIYSSDQLLQAARTSAGRQELAKHVNVDAEVILELAKRADLARVRGIGGVFADLLEYMGVETVGDLATHPPGELHAQMLETNGQSKLAGRLPTLGAVENWVSQATQLPNVLEY